jgi:ribonuclease D
MTNLPNPILVADRGTFEKTVAALSKASMISVDTESNSLFAYRERVCLIQFSTVEADFLVDPLSIDDISALGNIFSNPGIQKIFHAAEYDLLCLKRDYDFGFANLFDTMVAARILGREKVGLGNILEAEFDIKLEKRFQKANWGKRPLPSDMLAYARFDTHYLDRLRGKFTAELKSTGRWPIAQEDFGRLSQANGTPPGPVDTNIWRINGSRDLSPQQAAILLELVNYRDKKARSYDIPSFKVLGDKVLLAIASLAPIKPHDFKAIKNMSEKLIRRHGKDLIAAVERGNQAKELKPPPRQRYQNGYPERVEALREWRKKAAIKLKVESDVVLPRDLLIEIAAKNPSSEMELNTILQSTPWRLNKYGIQIKRALENL